MANGDIQKDYNEREVLSILSNLDKPEMRREATIEHLENMVAAMSKKIQSSEASPEENQMKMDVAKRNNLAEALRRYVDTPMDERKYISQNEATKELKKMAWPVGGISALAGMLIGGAIMSHFGGDSLYPSRRALASKPAISSTAPASDLQAKLDYCSTELRETNKFYDQRVRFNVVRSSGKSPKTFSMHLENIRYDQPIDLHNNENLDNVLMGGANYIFMERVLNESGLNKYLTPKAAEALARKDGTALDISNGRISILEKGKIVDTMQLDDRTVENLYQIYKTYGAALGKLDK